MQSTSRGKAENGRADDPTIDPAPTAPRRIGGRCRDHLRSAAALRARDHLDSLGVAGGSRSEQLRAVELVFLEAVAEEFGVEAIADLTREQYQAAKEYLESVSFPPAISLSDAVTFAREPAHLRVLLINMKEES